MLRNAREIASSIQERSRYTKHFEKALELCQIHIDIAARMNQSSCFFEVPEFIFGYPLYDINSCILFITQKLSEKEYFVHYFIPKLLYISWTLPTEPRQDSSALMQELLKAMKKRKRCSRILISSPST